MGLSELKSSWTTLNLPLSLWKELINYPGFSFILCLKLQVRDFLSKIIKSYKCENHKKVYSVDCTKERQIGCTKERQNFVWDFLIKSITILSKFVLLENREQYLLSKSQIQAFKLRAITMLFYQLKLVTHWLQTHAWKTEKRHRKQPISLERAQYKNTLEYTAK